MLKMAKPTKNGRFVISLSDSNSLRLHENCSGKVVNVVFTSGRSSRILCTAVSQDVIVCGSEDGIVRLWSEIGNEVREEDYLTEEDLVYSVALSPDGELVATGNNTKTIRVYSVSSRNFLVEFRLPAGRVWSLAFSPDSSILCSGGFDDSLRLWDPRTGHLLAASEDRSDDGFDFICSVAFSPSGKVIATGHSYGVIKVWSVNILSVKMKHTLEFCEELTGEIRSVAFSNSGTHIISCHSEGSPVQAVITSAVPSWTAYNEIAIPVICLLRRRGHNTKVPHLAGKKGSPTYESMLETLSFLASRRSHLFDPGRGKILSELALDVIEFLVGKVFVRP